MTKIKLVHIITALNVGGAEMMLYKLISNIDRKKFDLTVISLIDIGPIGVQIQKSNIPVIKLGMKRGVPDPRFIFKLAKILKSLKPDIIHTWMYHANLLGYFAGKLAKTPNIIWSIRHGELKLSTSKKTTIAVNVVSRILSKGVNKIIFCSEKSSLSHQKFGYPSNKSIVIPNGFDLDKFSLKKDNDKIEPILSIPQGSKVIGFVGRWNLDKDIENFIKAMGYVVQKLPSISIILCGEGLVSENVQLKSWINQSGVEKCIYLLGRRSDIPKIMQYFDVFVSSSITEGFSNVLGEAMACEVPCVATDVGDSAYIIGDTGIIVPAKNSLKLSDAIVRILSMSETERNELGKRARKRVIELFSISTVVNQYENIYNSLIYNKEGSSV